jgi:pimeloyl-ACP methyl ester carboxylesterase
MTVSEPDVLIEAAEGPAPLIITFGFAQWNAPVAFDFVGRLRKLEFLLGQSFHRIHLRDRSLSWYLHGLPGLGSNLLRTLDALASQVRALAPTRVLTLGQSMGGYGAILYGLALGADRIVAFGALSTMDPAVARAQGDPRWLSVMERLQAEGIRPERSDLVTLAAASARPLDLRLHYGEQPDFPKRGPANLDLFHAERFASLPGCRIYRHAEANHAPSLLLQAQGRLDAVLLRDLFDVDPGLVHQRRQPVLSDPQLQAMAGQLLRGESAEAVLESLLEQGLAPVSARSALAVLQRDPVFLAATQHWSEPRR